MAVRSRRVGQGAFRPTRRVDRGLEEDDARSFPLSGTRQPENFERSSHFFWKLAVFDQWVEFREFWTNAIGGQLLSVAFAWTPPSWPSFFEFLHFLCFRRWKCRIEYEMSICRIFWRISYFRSKDVAVGHFFSSLKFF